jgi:integrase
MKTIHGTERDAEIALARLLLEAGKLPETEVSVQQFCEEMWIPHLEERKRRRRTISGYRSIITHHISPELGELHLSSLTTYQLSRWLGGLKRVRGDKDKPLSDETRMHVYRCLFTALERALRWDLIERNPLASVDPPETIRFRKKDVLTEKEAGQYLDAFRGHVIESIVGIACGFRRCELAGLRWTDLDFEAGTIEITRGLHDYEGSVIEEEPKSVTSRRRIAVPDWAMAILKPLRGIGPLVPEDGDPMAPWRISEEFQKHVAAKKLRRIPLKNLRHTHGVLMLDKGVDLLTISRRLGHSTTAVTEAHYVDPTDRADRAAADLLTDPRKPEPSGAKSHPEPSREV